MSKQIDALVAARRKAAGSPEGAASKWGLALSGGGVRSATFCFGLLAALSRKGLLHRFDLLSTVSGGGYIGAMLGRLLNRARGYGEVRAVLDSLGARDARWFTWWLRANGRYLIPRGAADKVFAATVFVRNLVAIHLELGVLALLLGALLAGFDLLAWWGLSSLASVCAMPAGADAMSEGVPVALGHCGVDIFDAVRWLPEWLPTPWLLILLFMLWAGGLASAYWVVPWVATGVRVSIHWLLLCAVVVGLFLTRQLFLGDPGQPGAALRTVLLWGVLALAALWLLAIPWSHYLLRDVLGAVESSKLRAREDAVLRRLTGLLARAFRWGGLILLVGLVDRVAWFLAFEYRDLVQAGLVLAVLSAVLRALLPMASSLTPGSGGARGVLIVGRVAGYLLTFLLCAWWVSLVHLAGLSTLFGAAGEVEFGQALSRLALIGGLAAVYLWVTGSNFEFLNLSSLHTFYRARLVRSYLGAANPARFGAAPDSDPLRAIGKVSETVPRTLTRKSVFDPDDGDDVAMTEYAPQRFGGPVHLINACINQTRDPRGGLFNQDRRGLPLTIAPGGLMRVGLDGSWKQIGERGALSLGSWIAISGAAVAPGLGSNTQGGISALITFAGLRLGYWWSAVLRDGERHSPWRLPAKSRGLLSETFGVFKGAAGPDWFLSDGGHFENTGAYMLLAEQAEMIVVADCGADPDYVFGDLENLVRKARIDLGAEICFLKPSEGLAPGAEHGAALAAFGSLNDLASKGEHACLALAQVEYRDGGHALMIVVKPNLYSSLQVDLLNFAAENPDFPQQTTADQFFDEAQWESYYQLGSSLGSVLDPAFVDWLQLNFRCCFDADAGVSIGDAVGKEATEPAASKLNRLPARLRANAVTASIGIGGLVSIGLPVWNEIEKFLGAEAQRSKAEDDVLKELSEPWLRLPAPYACDRHKEALKAQASIGVLADALVRRVDTSCSVEYSGRFRDAVRRIYGDAVTQCQLLSFRDRPASCRTLLDAFVAGRREDGHPEECLLGQTGEASNYRAPRYWIYEYTATSSASIDVATRRHPADPQRRARLEQMTREREAEALSLAEEPCTVLATASPAGAQRPAPEPVPPPDRAPATDTIPKRPLGANDVCAGKTVFLQIYGQSMRDEVRKYRDNWRTLGASVPPIEDVVATAAKKGRASPKEVATTTVRYHDVGSKACAEALGGKVAQAGWKVEPLSPALSPTPGVIEVWIPNQNPPDSGADRRPPE